MIDAEVLAARRATVARLTRAGESANEIAVQLGVSRRTVIRIRRLTGCSLGEVGQPLTHDEFELAARLLAEGAPYSEAARTLGRDLRTIRKHFPGCGWTRGQGIEIRRMWQQLEAL